MKVKSIPSSWIGKNGCRFDCNPYMSGAIEARVKLESLSCKKQPLQDLTKGIVNAGRIKRIWAKGEGYGVPFLSSTDILKVDLSSIRYIANKAVIENPKLLINKGWTLITRAGSIGKMSYSRPDMDNMACTEDVLRVIPDLEKVLPGYLFAYLSSRYGVPLIVSGTYGAIIQHIEPEHIEQLPVPRLDPTVEGTIHDYIDNAATKRSEAAGIKVEINSYIQSLIDLNVENTGAKTSVASSHDIGRRFDALHFSRGVSLARKKLATGDGITLGSFVDDVFEPNRGKRFKVESEESGIPFLSSSEIFRLDPVGEYFISTSLTPKIETLIVTDKDLLIPRSGQVGGIIGRAVLPLPEYVGSAASEHIVRIRCKSEEDAYYLWAIFITQAGYNAIIGTSYGSSIPSLDCELIKQMRIPLVDDSSRLVIVNLVKRYVSNLSKAIKLERRALRVLEDAVEAATTEH